MDSSRAPQVFHGTLSIHEFFLCFLRSGSTHMLRAQPTDLLSQQVMCCTKEASDTRVDVQRFSRSCCRRLPSLGCRRVGVTLLVVDFPGTRTTARYFALPQLKSIGTSADVCFSRRSSCKRLHVTKQRLYVVRSIGAMLVYTYTIRLVLPQSGRLFFVFVFSSLTYCRAVQSFSPKA